MGLKRAHGNWVDGERFWDREQELASYIGYLEEGANLLVVAPRRIGKTSLLREAGRRIGDRMHYLFLDLEHCHTPEDVVVNLCLATREHRDLWSVTREVFQNALSHFKESLETVTLDEVSFTLRASVDHDWVPRATRLLADLAKQEKPLVLCLDEVPIFVSRLLKGQDFEITPARREATDLFMSWLRAMSIAHRGRIRFVLAGSIGLEPVLRQGGLSGTITTFAPFFLEPWDSDTTLGCLDALAQSYGVAFEADAAPRILEKLGCYIPHHVQLFFDLLLEDARHRRSCTISSKAVDRLYQTRMLASKGHAELSQLEERLMRVLGPRRMPLAIDLLSEAAIVGSVTAGSARILAADHFKDPQEAGGNLRDVLAILEHDGYLLREGEAFVFLSGLVRDWWKARFSFGYVPASDRVGP